jgi:hypothetical protein
VQASFALGGCEDHGRSGANFYQQVEPTVSGCTYSANRSGSIQASVSIGLFESSAKAQEGLKQYGDLESYKKLLKPGDTIESDEVAGLPAVFQIVRGVANMFVVKRNMIIAAGVNRVWSDGKKTPDRARSRALLAAALAKL